MKYILLFSRCSHYYLSLNIAGNIGLDVVYPLAFYTDCNIMTISFFLQNRNNHVPEI